MTGISGTLDPFHEKAAYHIRTFATEIQRDPDQIANSKAFLALLQHFNPLAKLPPNLLKALGVVETEEASDPSLQELTSGEIENPHPVQSNSVHPSTSSNSETGKTQLEALGVVKTEEASDPSFRESSSEEIKNAQPVKNNNVPLLTSSNPETGDTQLRTLKVVKTEEASDPSFHESTLGAVENPQTVDPSTSSNMETGNNQLNTLNVVKEKETPDPSLHESSSNETENPQPVNNLLPPVNNHEPPLYYQKQQFKCDNPNVLHVPYDQWIPKNECFVCGKEQLKTYESTKIEKNQMVHILTSCFMTQQMTFERVKLVLRSMSQKMCTAHIGQSCMYTYHVLGMKNNKVYEVHIDNFKYYHDVFRVIRRLQRYVLENKPTDIIMVNTKKIVNRFIQKNDVTNLFGKMMREKTYLTFNVLDEADFTEIIMADEDIREFLPLDMKLRTAAETPQIKTPLKRKFTGDSLAVVPTTSSNMQPNYMTNNGETLPTPQNEPSTSTYEPLEKVPKTEPAW
ncbi:hypothetical protein B9Z55_025751 [Caenorhabditis nigoni]|uniref:Lin-15A/B-like domain-containing protein n=1 Tax=Caenorhabditis nigoni TaxID=1611254 RepID=A0A2G5SZZ4_9PELO|nr:hypothetical protein B9Z55_025751 [Caenorhabditis nigoni]